MRHIVRLGAAAIGVFIMAGGALAMDTCSGEFSSSTLEALPAPAVVGLDLADSSPANAALAGSFSRGMSNAGVSVSGAQPPTVRLRLTWQVLGQGGSNSGQGSGGNPLVPMQPGSAATGASIWSGNSQTFLQGGIERSLPDMPSYDAFAPGVSAQSGLLIFRVEARGPDGRPIYWIGSVQCTMKGGDNQTLAYQLGQLVGGALGKRFERVAM